MPWSAENTKILPFHTTGWLCRPSHPPLPGTQSFAVPKEELWNTDLFYVSGNGTAALSKCADDTASAVARCRRVCVQGPAGACASQRSEIKPHARI